ncbi:MAG: choice-of-anchor Q domain-containing protein [Pseudolysinimonas sp.]
MRQVTRRLAAATATLSLALGGVVLVGAPASAATLIVTVATDDTVTPPAGGLREALQNANPGDVITFADGLPEIDLEGTISVAVGVTIDGGGDIVIGRVASVFTFPQLDFRPSVPNQDIELKDITVQGVVGGTGSAIYVTLNGGQAPRDVTFEGLVVKNELGASAGAVYVNGIVGDVRVTGSTFSGNTGTTTAGLNLSSVGSSAITVIDSTFSVNTATGSGAGLRIEDPTNADVTLSSVTFTGNQITGLGAGEGDGGALWIRNAKSLTIDGAGANGDSEFSGNSTSRTGGALWGAFLGEASITDTAFSDNTSTQDGGGAWLNFIDGTLDVEGATFSDNTTTASGSGGGLAIYNLSGTLTITGATFRDNTSAATGGGLYWQGGPSATISDSEFLSNSANRTGGAYIDEVGDDLTITRTTFGANDSTADVSGLLLGSVAAGATVTIDSSAFGLNTLDVGSPLATSLGTGLMLGTVTIVNSTFFETQESGVPALFFSEVDDDGFVSIAQSTIVTDGPAVTFGTLLDTDPVITGSILSSTDPAVVVSTAGAALVQVSWSIASNILGDAVDVTGNQLSTDPQLGTLGDHGGVTATILPLAGSPAINAGNPAFAAPPSLDQRGTGFPRVVGGRIDVGAVEVQAALAATGSTVPWWVIAIAAGVVLLGVVTFVLTRRARSELED